jgi:hypothetical protein
MTSKRQTRQRRAPRAILAPMTETAHRNGWQAICEALRDLLTRWEARQCCAGGRRNDQ